MLRTLANWLLGKTTGSSPLQSTSSTIDPLAVRLCERCEKPQKIHITLMVNKDLQSQVHLCEECARRFLEQPPEKDKSKEIGPDVERRLVVDKLIISELHDQQVLLLRELEGNRSFPIVLGSYEALVIDFTLRRVAIPRPLTHDAWLASITSMGAKIQAGCIIACRDTVYYAELRITRDSETFKIDLRPSDALAICLKADAPFLISERILADVQTS